jgi:hypothetical protein
MFPLSHSSHSARDTGGIDRIHKSIELHDTDVAELRSLSISGSLFPRLRPGDLVHLSSGGSSVFRRVERIETIAGDCILIWLDPGYMKAGDSRASRLGLYGKTSR